MAVLKLENYGGDRSLPKIESKSFNITQNAINVSELPQSPLKPCILFPICISRPNCPFRPALYFLRVHFPPKTIAFLRQTATTTSENALLLPGRQLAADPVAAQSAQRERDNRDTCRKGQLGI